MEENRELEQAFESPKQRMPLWVKLVIAAAVLTVVLFIPCVGLVATLVVPKILDRLGTAQVTKAKADIVTLRGAVEAYAMDNGGRFPSSFQDLAVSHLEGATHLVWDGGAPVDPWGHPYVFEPPESGTVRFRISSMGADGVPGGEGENRDIDDKMIRDGEI